MKARDLLTADQDDEIERTLPPSKVIALVAHDHRKRDLLAWIDENKARLQGHRFVATGTTGALVANRCGLSVVRFQSGPLGGDQQLGAAISQGEVDLLIFFWDPLEAQPHDPDIKALLRLAVLYNVPTASNRATADFIVTSPFFAGDYRQRLTNYSKRRPTLPPL